MPVQCSLPLLAQFQLFFWCFQCAREVCICLSTALKVTSKFTMSHPSTCEGAMSAKNEKLHYVLLVEYKIFLVLWNASAKYGYCAFWGSGDLEATICICVVTPLATSSSWNSSHPSEKLLNWSTKYILYDTNQLQLRKYELNSINNLIDTLQIILLWFSSGKLPLLTVVCYPEALKNKRSSRTWLVHPSFPHLWLRWKFFEKIRNVFLHHLAALSSCNMRFEGAKWELSQLEYSGEMQLFQKDSGMEKHMWMLFWQEKHTQNTEK